MSSDSVSGAGGSRACRWAVLLLAASLGTCPAASSLAPPAGPGTADEYEVKAVFVYNFARYMQWPVSEQTGSFEIAVLGDSAIVAPLQAIAARRTVQAREIAIRQVSDTASLGHPQVLFVARPAAPRLAQVLERTRGQPVLTVAEEDGLATRGIAVNFVVSGESIRFEINQDALRQHGIRPSSQLLRLAILVGGPR